MAVAKERTPLVRTLERVPHSKVAYAFLELEVTGTTDEFLAFRSEMLEKHPLYAPSAFEAKVAAAPAGDEATDSGDESAEAPAEPEAPPAPTGAAAPTSARDIARAKILAKRAEGSK